MTFHLIRYSDQVDDFHEEKKNRTRQIGRENYESKGQKN